MNDECDWPKPPGCHCNTIARARACYERCDDAVGFSERRRVSIEDYIVAVTIAAAIAITIIASYLIF